MNNEWNLIVQTCEPCNNAKSSLEDDISAITMHPDIAGNLSSEDPRLAIEIARKAEKAISRRTKKPVKDSIETLAFDLPVGSGINFNFSVAGSPQVDEERVFKLAHYHIQAFFYLLSFNQEMQTGHLIPGTFAPLIYVKRTDWGNDLIESFTKMIHTWDHRLLGISANGFFKAIIRRHPEGKDVWAWALEWNQNFRLIGFFGNIDEIHPVANSLEKLELRTINAGPNRVLRIRTEKPLLEDRDFLFSFDFI